MRISDEVYNCLINQAIVLKHETKQNGSDIANKMVEEYFDRDELTIEDRDALIFKISSILSD
jgi:hypothetical protein